MKYCTYCGDLATDRDHVIPLAWYGGTRVFRNKEIVPACKECNRSILKDRPYFTVEDRCEYVAKMLRKKLLKALSRYNGDDMPSHIAVLALRADYALDKVKSTSAVD